MSINSAGGFTCQETICKNFCHLDIIFWYNIKRNAKLKQLIIFIKTSDQFDVIFPVFVYELNCSPDIVEHYQSERRITLSWSEWVPIKHWLNCQLINRKECQDDIWWLINTHKVSAGRIQVTASHRCDAVSSRLYPLLHSYTRHWLGSYWSVVYSEQWVTVTFGGYVHASMMTIDGQCVGLVTVSGSA